jgi:hypothetical protein
VAESSTDDVLRWEARQGPRAAAAAATAAVLGIAPGIATYALFNDAPPGPGLADSLARAGRAGGVGSLPSLRTPSYEYYDDRAGTVMLTAVLTGLGFVAVAFMLVYLGLAVRNRGVGFRRSWIYVALAGGLLGAIGAITFTVARSVEIGKFLDGPHTVDRAADIGDSSVLVTAQLIGIPGTQAIGLASLSLGLGWVVICLNAMRVGLLTRLMGVLGIICGALIVLPILSPLPIVQTFWLGAMALLLLGRWPNGVPPAWVTGEAQPWPSQQEAREARAGRGGPEPEPEPDPEPRTRSGNGRAQPSSRKKKRKRRA